MSENTEQNKSTLVRGMFINAHQFESGKVVLNLSINVAEMCKFLKDNYLKDRNDNCWVRAVVRENQSNDSKYSHTTFLDTYYHKNAEEVISKIAEEFIEEIDENIVAKEKAQITADTKTKAKKSKAKAKKSKAKIVAAAADDLPF